VIGGIDFYLTPLFLLNNNGEDVFKNFNTHTSISLIRGIRLGTEERSSYIYNNTRKFDWKNIKDIWVSQGDDDTCQLGALRIVLRYYNRDIDEKKLIEALSRENFNIFDFGTYLPFIGVIALRLGFQIDYRTELSRKHPETKTIISAPDTIKKIILEDLENTDKEEPILQAYNAFLKILDIGGKIYFHQPHSPPSFTEIEEALKTGPVIALVTGKEYYNIDEEWNHALVLVPADNNNYIVFDDFEEKGYHYTSKWEKHLEYSRKYNWEKWKGRMLEFEKK
jgi:hypothetical protein